MKKSPILETLQGFRKKAQSCLDLMKKSSISLESTQRLETKASTYNHCADLLENAIERAMEDS